MHGVCGPGSFWSVAPVHRTASPTYSSSGRYPHDATSWGGMVLCCTPSRHSAADGRARRMALSIFPARQRMHVGGHACSPFARAAVLPQLHASYSARSPGSVGSPVPSAFTPSIGPLCTPTGRGFRAS